MQRKRYDILASRYWDVCLVNARVEDGRLLCGFAHFEGGGLSEQVAVFPPSRPNEIFWLEVPQRAQQTLTNVVMTSPTDELEFKLVEKNG
ncbi:hypothetical protein H6G00_00675 [Leptolyngbya sp. FACHB-541]|uniref:hypothetical protein n=1 Tax=Leptolyngbya sp. FACHB-541 TaxID=2692810 RepID=UPI00168713FC|nr:hypothetical protein [Leptolyngbya sp. FACHB-541]MBD1995141.1 hypothetical protein [Leptolyngbya sp. FACHB-541]